MAELTPMLVTWPERTARNLRHDEPGFRWPALRAVMDEAATAQATATTEDMRAWRSELLHLAAARNSPIVGINEPGDTDQDAGALSTPFNPALFEHFIMLPFARRLLTSIRDELDSALDRTPAYFHDEAPRVLELFRPRAFAFFAICRWEQYGRQCYRLDPSTFELLVNTDLPRMPARFLRVPIGAFWVQFPPRRFFFGAADTDLTVRTNRLLGVEYDPRQPIDGAMVVFSDTEPTDGGTPREMHLIIGGNAADGDDDLLFQKMKLDDRQLSELTDVERTSELLSSGQEEVTILAPRVVLNLILYLMQEHPRLTPIPPPKRKRFGHIRSAKERATLEAREATRLEALSRVGYLYVGTPDDLPEEDRPQQAAGKWRLTHKVWVRGHWKNQAYGPQRAYRRMIHIRPFFKGPDLLSEATNLKTVQPAQERPSVG